MGRSQETFSKREKEKKRLKKKQEKEQKRAERKAEGGSGSLDDMIAYVDQYGNIVDTPPEEKREEINAEDIAISVAPKEEEEEQSPFRSGKVAFFNDSKGYGFIQEDGGDKYFYHISNAQFDTQDNDKVTFEIERGPKGLVAVNIAKASAAE
jgi:cold shock CspA family protein